MKKCYISCWFCLLGLLTLNAQNTIWVSNNPNYALVADEANLQTAIDNAASGDTLMIYPSGWSYGDITINKEVHLIGFGFKTDTASQASLEINVQPFDTYVKTVTVTPEGAGGSLESLRTTARVTVNGSNFRVVGCYLYSLYAADISNLELLRNFVGGGVISSARECPNGSNLQYNMRLNNVQSAVLLNNIFSYVNTSASGSCQYRRNLYVESTCSNVVIRNNLFRDIADVQNSLVYNNIFTENGRTGLTTNSVVDNNFFCGTSGNPDCATVFAAYPTQGDYSFDGRFQLLPTSPAKGAGRDGADCGVFAGSRPYRLSGIPQRPLIYQLDVPDEVEGGSMNIQVKVRSGN